MICIKRFLFLLVAIVAVSILPAPDIVPEAAAQNVACYREQGGAKNVAGSGCEYEFQSGSTLDVQSGTTVSNAGALTLTTGGSVDINGIADGLVLDADADTTISAPTDDQVDVEINGVDHIVLKAVATADAAATTSIGEIVFTSPVDTTGTNTHNGLTIDIAIGNATGGTNAVNALQIDAITGDGQVTETAINIGSGYDSVLTVDGVALAATVAELNLAADLSARYEDVTTTNVITAAECGKTFYLNSATEFASTLPAVSTADGCELTFIVKAAPSSASYTILTGNSLENVLIGYIVSADLDAGADGDVSTADDTITIEDGVAVVGDRVTLNSDGTSWYYIAYARTFNGITADQAD